MTMKPNSALVDKLSRRWSGDGWRLPAPARGRIKARFGLLSSAPAAPRGSLLPLLLLLIGLLWGCGSPDPLRPNTYAFSISPGNTFALHEGQRIPSPKLVRQLDATRLLFLGEHHTEPRSHAFQREILELLVARGRKVTVALEMLPPSANDALDGWRSGQLDEEKFLENSKWYSTWAFSWSYYRQLFETIRDHKIPVRGVNAEKATREAVRKGDLSKLEPAVREDLTPLAPELAPHTLYLQDVLGKAGHGGDVSADSPLFQSYRRVQWMWDRLMGARSARLAEKAGKKGIVVVLIGSGHLAYKLGANLQAARGSNVSQLTVWDDVVERNSRRLYPVPVGMADLVRIYEKPKRPLIIPNLRGLKLEKTPEGVRIARVSGWSGKELKDLEKGDIVITFGGIHPESPTALRLAYEGLTIGTKALWEVQRGEEVVTLNLEVERPFIP